MVGGIVLVEDMKKFASEFITQIWNDRSQDVYLIVIRLILAYIVFSIVKFIIDRIFESKLQKYIYDNRRVTSPQRTKTLSKVTRNALNYALYFFFAYSVLSIVGFPISTLVASAGIAGVAFGLGAKEFVTDMINGFFIIFEGQFDIGEVIEIPSKSIKGKVVQVGIRSTSIVSADGNIYYIPNSEISIVNNMSRENKTIVIDIPIDITKSLSQFSQVIFDETEKIAKKFDEQLTNSPNIIGLVRIGTTLQDFVYRITFEVKNGTQVHLSSAFYQQYIEAIQQKEIEKNSEEDV